jgi:hypothetical protein
MNMKAACFPETLPYIIKKKGKTIPVTGHEGP